MPSLLSIARACAQRVRAAPYSFAIWFLALLSMASAIHAYGSVQPLSERDGFREATDFLSVHARDGVFVTVWPPHLADAVEQLPSDVVAADAVPLGEEVVGAYPYVALLSLAGARPPPELARAEQVGEVSFGALALRLYRRGNGNRVLFDLRQQLDEVKVVLRGEKALACTTPRVRGGWQCPGRPEWNYVAPTELWVAGARWPSVWAHPVTNQVLELDMGVRSLGTMIELSAALSDDAARMPTGASVRLELDVGQERHVLDCPNKVGMVHRSIHTDGQRAHLRLRIRTEHDGRRHLAVNVRVVQPQEELRWPTP